VTSSGGCSIYKDRPEVCKQFECFWKQGVLGGESHRPDKLGIMFTASEKNGIHVIHAWELKPDHIEDDKIQRILTEIGKIKTFVTVRYHGLMKLVGTNEGIEQFIRHQTGLVKICDYNLGPGMLEGELVVIYENVKDKKMTLKMPNRIIPVTPEEKNYVIQISSQVLDGIVKNI
jgi:hypothetical protein